MLSLVQVSVFRIHYGQSGEQRPSSPYIEIIKLAQTMNVMRFFYAYNLTQKAYICHNICIYGIRRICPKISYNSK